MSERQAGATLGAAAASLRAGAGMLGEAQRRLGALDPGPRTFGASGAGRLGDLSHDLYLLWQRSLEARMREAAAHATRLHEAAEAVARAGGGYVEIDETARRSQPEVS